jgi:hypothetical protein
MLAFVSNHTITTPPPSAELKLAGALLLEGRALAHQIRGRDATVHGDDVPHHQDDAGVGVGMGVEATQMLKK